VENCKPFHKYSKSILFMFIVPFSCGYLDGDSDDNKENFVMM
jgi:hypothetical protein